MSGAFGWINNAKSSVTPASSSVAAPFDAARNAYQPPLTYINQSPSNASPRQLSATPSPTTRIPDGLTPVKSTAANVLIFVQDVTGSMNEWPQEIFQRLPLLYGEACKYLRSDDVEILFIAHGDARTDQHPIQVAQFGRGADLDQTLLSFYLRCGGGGQGTESQELVAYFLLKYCDTSSARHVYTYFITDEAGCDQVSADLARQYLPPSNLSENLSTKQVFQALLPRMSIYTVLCETQSYDPAPIRQWWQSMLGPERVISLNDHRRIVDTVLGVIAVTTGQTKQFTQDLQARQAGSRFAGQNIHTVLSSIALVGRGTPSEPFQLPGGGTRPLLPPAPASKLNS